jgi:hypothetical protein
MKLHITAALVISSILFNSCGGTAETVSTEKPSAQPTINNALEWSTSSMEARFVYEQNIRIALEKINMMMDRGESMGKGLFVDAAFLLFNQSQVYEFFKTTGKAGSEFNIHELGEFCRLQFEPSMIQLLQRANEAGMSIYLMASEEEVSNIFIGLNSENIMVQSCVLKYSAKYGKYAENMTLAELNEEGRIGLVLTTSLGEITSMQGELPIAGRSISDLYKTLGEKLILFPNPAFN